MKKYLPSVPIMCKLDMSSRCWLSRLLIHKLFWENYLSSVKVNIYTAHTPTPRLTPPPCQKRLDPLPGSRPLRPTHADPPTAPRSLPETPGAHTRHGSQSRNPLSADEWPQEPRSHAQQYLPTGTALTGRYRTLHGERNEIGRWDTMSRTLVHPGAIPRRIPTASTPRSRGSAEKR